MSPVLKDHMTYPMSASLESIMSHASLTHNEDSLWDTLSVTGDSSIPNLESVPLFSLSDHRALFDSRIRGSTLGPGSDCGVGSMVPLPFNPIDVNEFSVGFTSCAGSGSGGDPLADAGRFFVGYHDKDNTAQGQYLHEVFGGPAPSHLCNHLARKVSAVYLLVTDPYDKGKLEKDLQALPTLKATCVAKCGTSEELWDKLIEKLEKKIATL